MKSFYSILYITLNATLNERVSIGMLFTDGQNHFFKHSPEKLLALKVLIEDEKYSIVKSYLRSIENNVNNSKINLFGKKQFRSDWITENYISYLSNYSNNLIQFSEPKFIDISFNFQNFKLLFEKYVHSFDLNNEDKITESIFNEVRKNLYPKISKCVNIDIELNCSHFEDLFVPIEVSFIGVNGTTVAGKTIDFSKKHYYLENDITRFVSLTKAIEIEKKFIGKYYVVGREPGINDYKNHLLWEQIRDSHFLEFIDIDEVGIIDDYIKHNNVRPYFELNEDSKVDII